MIFFLLWHEMSAKNLSDGEYLTTMRSPWLFAAFTIMVLVVTIPRIGAAEPHGTNVPPGAGTARMAGLLDQAARRLHPMLNTFLSAERAAIMGPKVAAMPRTAASAPSHFTLGTELLNAGRN